MRSLSVSSISATEPIDTTACNLHLRIDATSEDALVAIYIKAARQQCENIVRRSLVPTSYCMYMDQFYDRFTLPRPPISSTAADVVITYINDTGGTSTCSSTRYDVDFNSEPGEIFLASSAAWPTDIMDRENAVKVAYKAGYTTATLPESIRVWLMQRVGVLYKYREPVVNLKPSELPRSFIDGLLDEHMVYDELDYLWRY